MSTPRSGPRAGLDAVLADAHAGYHDETRRHQPPDVLVDDVVTYRMLAPHLMRAGLFLVVPTVLLLIWLLLGYLASMSSPSSAASTITSLVGFVGVVLYLAGLAAFVAPAKEPIAEYSQLLEGRADAAEAAYAQVRRATERRRSPAEIRPSTVAGVPVLLFSQRSERAMLLVQPYGEDLYVGWTMWRSRSSATLLGHFLRDTFGRFAAAPRFSSELRAASTRALRESVHSLSREGVVAALHAGESATGSGSADGRGPGTGSWERAPRDAGSAGGAPWIDGAWADGAWADGAVESGRWSDGAVGSAASTELPRGTAAWSGARDGGAEQYASAPRRRRGPEHEGWGPPPAERR